MSIDKTLVSGSVTMLLLKLLSEKDMYGYEMISTLRERSQNVFELKAGSLYPFLPDCEAKDIRNRLSVRKHSVNAHVMWKSSRTHTYPFPTKA